MGPPGEAQEAGAAIEGVRLSLYAQFSHGPRAGGGSLWAPWSPWLMLRGRPDAWAQAQSQAPPLGPSNH